MTDILIFIVAWLACGIVACGIFFASIQRGYPTVAYKNYRIDTDVALLILLVGLVGLLGMALVLLLPSNAHFHGWLWPWGAKAKKESGL